MIKVIKTLLILAFCGMLFAGCRSAVKQPAPKDKATAAKTKVINTRSGPVVIPVK